MKREEDTIYWGDILPLVAFTIALVFAITVIITSQAMQIRKLKQEIAELRMLTEANNTIYDTICIKATFEDTWAATIKNEDL